MTNGLKYCKKHLTVFDLNRVNKKKYWKCERNTFILPHKREYGLQLHLEHSRRPNCWKSHKPQWRIGQNIAKNIWQSLIWAELTEKKYSKCDSNTFIIPHKREDGLLPVLKCSRNCWKKNASYNAVAVRISHKKHIAVFSPFVLTEKKYLKCERKTFVLPHKR